MVQMPYLLDSYWQSNRAQMVKLSTRQGTLSATTGTNLSTTWYKELKICRLLVTVAASSSSGTSL